MKRTILALLVFGVASWCQGQTLADATKSLQLIVDALKAGSAGDQITHVVPDSSSHGGNAENMNFIRHRTVATKVQSKIGKTGLESKPFVAELTWNSTLYVSEVTDTRKEAKSAALSEKPAKLPQTWWHARLAYKEGKWYREVLECETKTAGRSNVVGKAKDAFGRVIGDLVDPQLVDTLAIANLATARDAAGKDWEAIIPPAYKEDVPGR